MRQSEKTRKCCWYLRCGEALPAEVVDFTAGISVAVLIGTFFSSGRLELFSGDWNFLTPVLRGAVKLWGGNGNDFLTPFPQSRT